MELLSNLFGNLASGLIRLAVAVGIILATYLFLVKPVLHAVHRSFHQSKGRGRHDPQKLLRCVQRANGSVSRMQVCANRY